MKRGKLTKQTINQAPNDGFGYGAHSARNKQNDRAVCSAANKMAISVKQFEEFVNCKLGRWLGDELTFATTDAQRQAKAAAYLAKFLQA